MARSSNTEKTLRLNAAFDLLAQGHSLADSAEALTQKPRLWRRQAYRYLQEAQRFRQFTDRETLDHSRNNQTL
jgi:hypothetical protein